MTTLADLSEILTTEELAKALRVSKNTIYEEVRAGRLPVSGCPTASGDSASGQSSTGSKAKSFTAGGDIAPTAQPHGTPTARVRSTLTIASDRESMTAQWERSEERGTWHPWMDIRFSLVTDV